MTELQLSPFQQRVLQIPEEFDLFLGGGRGGAKSHTMALVALRRVEQHGAAARVLYLRKTYRGLADFELVTRDIFGKIYGGAARYNMADHVWRFGSGAYMELGQLDGPGDYLKYQGRSFNLLLVDEAGQYPDPQDLDMLRSNLRSKVGVRTRVVLAANPGGPGHAWLSSRYVFRAPPWRPFRDERSQREWICAPSTYLDNPFIDREEYQRELTASCPHDAELLRAWLQGDWAIARGAFFAGVLSEQRSAINAEEWRPPLRLDGWSPFIAHDFGTSAPSATYVCLRSPGAPGPDGHFYPRGSVVALDELVTAQHGRPSAGLGWTVDKLAEAILELCDRWRVRPVGCADDAIFARARGYGAATIADEFAACGVRFSPARKADRLTGWERMRKMMAAAGSPDQPGLYVARQCAYFWQTVPSLPRDERRPQDVDTDAPDHAADALRYALIWERPQIRRGTFGGRRRA